MTRIRATVGRAMLGMFAVWIGACLNGEVIPPDCAGASCPDSEQPVRCICPDVYQPVCGKDDKTYGNACEAACASIPVAHEGECRPDAGPGETCICPAIYKPVCGKDGKTYGNACEARCAGIPVAHEGECKNAGGASCQSNADCARGTICYPPTHQCQPECTIACLVYDPVCGADGTTYGCGEADAHCHGVEVASPGECAPSTGCTYGGKTYKPGESFPSSDGCNSCGCTADGTVACTLRACACNYDAPGRTWTARSPEQCRLVKFACPSGQQPFFNDCGCGCEGVPAPVTCRVDGCSGQLCVGPGEPDISTCEWREAYACYRTAKCGVQASGKCGWTQTEELRGCIKAAQP